MPRKPEKIECSPQERRELGRIALSRKVEVRLAERAKIILRCLDGVPVKDIAEEFGVRPNTVINRRRRFASERLQALVDKPRSGKPCRYGDEFRKLVLKTVKKNPPQGYQVWDGPLLARHLNASPDAVWRVLRKEGVCLARRRSWCVSTDPQFAAKAADVVGLYLAPPENAIILSVDEKPSIQALTRQTGYVYTGNKKIVRGYKSTYKRNGTLNLFAALSVTTGTIYGKVTKNKKRPDFLAFMDDLIKELPQGKEYHVILDNYCIHKRCDQWLAKNSNVFFHYTPTSASWLNMIEIWFCIFTRKVLNNGSFNNKDDLREAIEAFIKAYNENDAHPFIWRKRQVKGAQLRDNIDNLCS